MQSLENNTENLPGSQQKINEYTERINNGEDAAKVMEGLGSFMRDAIKKKLIQNENSQNVETLGENLKEQKKLEDENKIEEIRARLDLPEKWKSVVKERIEEESIDYELLKPEEVLIKLAEYCEPYMSAPIEAVGDGTFAGLAKLKIEAGNVILIRHAADEDHLIKKGKPASAQEMSDSSLFSGGAHDAGVVHASADIDNWVNLYDRYPIYGEFRIPVKEFLNLGKEGKIIIGNLGEAEIVLSGDVAKKYLTKIVDKNKN